MSALYLASRRARHRIDDVHAVRHLEARKVFAAIGAYRILVSIGRHHHSSLYCLSVHCVRYSEAHRLSDRWMPQQRSVNLQRRNLLTAAIYQLLEAARQRERAVGVEKALVARAEPAIRERLRIRIRIIVVAMRDIRAPYDHFGEPACADKIAVVVHDANVNARALAHRAWHPIARRQQVGRHLMRRLGHSVCLKHRRAEPRLQLLEHRRSKRR